MINRMHVLFDRSKRKIKMGLEPHNSGYRRSAPQSDCERCEWTRKNHGAVSMGKAKLIVFLLFVPAMLAELLTGNAPPVRFFSPLWLFFFVLLYGCGCLLIREMKVRWNLQWGVLFLAVAYAIVEEGLTTKAFFNPEWEGVGLLSGYGMCWGVQWVWTLGVTFAHATTSILVPITIADHLWPRYRHAATLRRRGVLVALAGISSITVLGMLSFGKAEGSRTIPFHPHPLLLIGAFLCVVLLCWFAYRSRSITVSTDIAPLLRPSAFFIIAFLVNPFFLVVPNEMVKNNATAMTAILAELTMIVLVLSFGFFQLCHRKMSGRHTTALVLGFLMPWILLTPLHEFQGTLAQHKSGTGMSAVGIVALIGLLLWRHVVLKNEGKVFTTAESNSISGSRAASLRG